MPQDKQLDKASSYTIYMLDLFKDDIIADLGKQHEGCYRVDIMKLKINDLFERYAKQITKDILAR